MSRCRAGIDRAAAAESLRIADLSLRQTEVRTPSVAWGVVDWWHLVHWKVKASHASQMAPQVPWLNQALLDYSKTHLTHRASVSNSWKSQLFQWHFTLTIISRLVLPINPRNWEHQVFKREVSLQCALIEKVEFRSFQIRKKCAKHLRDPRQKCEKRKMFSWLQRSFEIKTVSLSERRFVFRRFAQKKVSVHTYIEKITTIFPLDLSKRLFLPA